MHLKRSFAVIGGDLRQRCLLRQLRGLGFPASAYRVPDAEDSAPDLSGSLRGANVLILPMPAGGGVPLADILDAAEPGALICGGMLDPAEALLQARGISFYDYAKDEALLLQNAELTPEAALALLLKPDPALRLWAHRKAAGAQAESAWRGRDRLGAEGAGSGACAHSRLSPRHGRKLGRRARAVRRDRQHRSRTDHRPGAAAMHPPGLRAAGACQPARRVLRRGAGASGVLRRAWSSGQIRAGGCRRHHPKRHIP